MHRRPLPLPGLAVLFVALVACLAAPSAASAYSAPGPRWPGTTIRYYQAMHPSWTWSVSRAAQSWSGTGAPVRLVRVSSRAQAQVVVETGRTRVGNAGQATLGSHPRARLTIAGRAGQRLALRDRIPMYTLIAHEFGHVLGLNHEERTGCELMRPYPLSQSPLCRVAGPPVSGMYQCGLATRDDVRGLVSLYGGRPRFQRRWCPIEPAPPQLRNVQFSGGDAAGAPVRISWTLPPGIPAGAAIEVGAWVAGRCGSTMQGDVIERQRLRTSATSWTQVNGGAPTRNCYQVRIVNRWGYGAAPLRGTLTSFAPRPAAPVVGTLVEYPDDVADYGFQGSFAEGTEPRAAWGPTGACPTAPDLDGGTPVSAWSLLDGQHRLGTVPTGPGCISIFAVDQIGIASPATTVEVVHSARPEA